MSGAEGPDPRDLADLRRAGARETFAVLRHARGGAEAAAAAVGVAGSAAPFCDALMVRAPAARLASAARDPSVLDLEIVDPQIALPVSRLLGQLGRLVLWRRAGVYRPGAVNLSLGPPRTLLNRRRTADRTIRRAYAAASAALEAPVVVAAGNEGPAPGSLNPWADAEGVIAVTAADSGGRMVADLSGRPADGAAPRCAIFAAHGVDSIGAHDSRATKTPAEREAEVRIGLAALVGPENLERYAVRSGTSFAAAETTRILGYAHQAAELLRACADATRPLEARLEPYLRAVVDTAIDRSHPAFLHRLADERMKFAGLDVAIDPERRRAYGAALLEAGFDAPIRHDAASARRFLGAIARPVPGAAAAAQGEGFVSEEAAQAFLRGARLSDLVTLYAEPGDARIPGWRAAFAAAGDPLLFTAREVEAIGVYCRDASLILALPLFPEATRAQG